ncbi:MAG: flavin reductase [Oscillibacter sp.]|jgi:flavin reductase (DIM6/NTAB) family NADH-FMN oxidoreductase RutF|nr:flavin reductase [Oscillibacter sp.]
MNTMAYEKLDYSLALLGATADGKRQGCIINSLHQATSSYPAKFTVTLSKSHETTKAVEAAGSFSVTLLDAGCPDGIINDFGYKSGRVGDKFASYDAKADDAGNPYLTEHMISRISCKVVDKLDLGNYVLYVGQVTEAEVLGEGAVLTLNAFTERGKPTPTTASVYRTVEINGYRCPLCGYVYEGENPPPADWRCPICNEKGSEFTKIETN